ncbi:MAG: phosphotransferase [Elusimicrobia bacterium]|nr:phosphotransferase [Elusimicrobiota bacterium]
MGTIAQASKKILSTEEALAALFKRRFGASPETMKPLASDGSSRKYFRLSGASSTAIGAFGPDPKENAAFLGFGRYFRTMGLNTPEIYAEDAPHRVYLEEDLGDTTLFSLLQKNRQGDSLGKETSSIYEQVIEHLVRFQITAAKDLDYKLCYPRSSFDRQSMMWDFNYFKYYFLRLAQIPFNEQALENDFGCLAEFLLETPGHYFLYRDFQSRNIMVKNGAPWFIDFQGGRRGALQYDIASLLFDAKADVPFAWRDEWLGRYIKAAAALTPMDEKAFRKHYWGFVLIRIMQAMGAYGLRGFYERKGQFLQSIPYAIRNLEYLLRHRRVPKGLSELSRVLERLVGSSYLRQFGEVHLKLTVSIQSFSYRGGFVMDNQGHGGGYIFDCRALPNPGRFEKYASLTGKDSEVIRFLSQEENVRRFLENVFHLIEQSVENYQKRNFTDLSVAFGCTGGRHRSVYCAEKLSQHLKGKYAVDIELRHRSLEEIRPSLK